MDVQELLKRLVQWFLSKAPPRLETLEEERIEGVGVTLIRYRRKTARAYRTWRAIYRGTEFDIIFGWDTLEYRPDVPTIHKRNRLSTHSLSIYRQGLHARYNPQRRIHEPDISLLVNDEVCMEAGYMQRTIHAWRVKSKDWETPIIEKKDLYNYIIDQVALYVIRHPPTEIDPLLINWREVVEQSIRLNLGLPEHQVFPKTDL